MENKQIELMRRAIVYPKRACATEAVRLAL